MAKVREIPVCICIYAGFSITNKYIHMYMASIYVAIICIYVCMYIYMYAYIYIYMHAYIYIYVDIYVYIYVFLFWYVCVRICQYVYIYIYTHMSILKSTQDGNLGRRLAMAPGGPIVTSGILPTASYACFRPVRRRRTWALPAQFRPPPNGVPCMTQTYPVPQ